MKKELRNEHLKNEHVLCEKVLGIEKHSQIDHGKKTCPSYEKAIQEEEKGEDIAEFITSRWLLKNSELYEFFEKHLSQIQADFASIEELTPQQAQVIIEAANGIWRSSHLSFLSAQLRCFSAGEL